MSIIIEGWLVKDGNMLGSWKNRYCTLAFARNQFTLDYFVGDNKAEKKGTFNIPRKSGFAKAPDSGDIKNCFSIEVGASESRKAGTKVTFSAPTKEAFAMWENAFLTAKPHSEALVVVGSSGLVGSATLKALSAHANTFTIKAGVRDVKSPKNASFAAPGVHVVAADMSKPKDLAGSLVGAKCAFVVVPGTADRTQLGINGVRACKEAGVKHIVLLSVTVVAKPDTLFGAQFIPIEQAVKTCGIPYTIVRLPMFYENVLGQTASIISSGKFYSALEDNGHNAISVADIGAAVAKIMTRCDSFKNKILNLTGSKLVKEKDFADGLTKSCGFKVEYVAVSYMDQKESMMAMGMPEWQVDGVTELQKLIADKDALFTNVASDLPALLGRELATPATMCEFAGAAIKAQKEAAEFAAKAEAERVAAELAALKLAAKNGDKEAIAKIAAMEKEKKDKAAAELLAKQIAATKQTINNGGLVLKKFGDEAAYRPRFVWIDDDKKELCWSKTETKDGSFKSIKLATSTVISEPKADGAKPATMLVKAEADGFTFNVDSKSDKTVDLKIEGTKELAEAWIHALHVICGHPKPAAPAAAGAGAAAGLVGAAAGAAGAAASGMSMPGASSLAPKVPTATGVASSMTPRVPSATSAAKSVL